MPKFNIDDDVSVPNDSFSSALLVFVFGWGRKSGKVAHVRRFKSTTYSYRVEGLDIDPFRRYLEAEVELERVWWKWTGKVVSREWWRKRWSRMGL